MNFWENVDEELKFRGMERKELGAKAGFPESYISKGIARKSCPSADLALRIAKVLNVSIEYLLTGEEPKKKNADQGIKPEIKQLISKMNHFSQRQAQVIFDMAKIISEK